MQTLKPRIQVLNTRVAKTHTQTERIRGGNLQRIRDGYLRLSPLCLECMKVERTSLAAEVDHIIPLWAGGKEEDSNRQGLCVDHHSVKTSCEDRMRKAGGWLATECICGQHI